MTRKSRRSRSIRRKPKIQKCEVYKTGPITVNPFLNFVRDVRKNAKGLSVCEIVSKAGRLWRRMNDEQKKPYYHLAKKARELKSRGHKSSHRDRKRRESDRSLSDSCREMPVTRCASQKTIRPKTAASTRSLNRTRSRPGL
ncbi:unnamed protein product [Callosobruchus maculatus]|uniref:HMG box domain-containing protein n=1 Tax=Callosobruchus maculatus TaxID=64391 RepID=A0A653BYK4_CALMS|nr:unnamed protein product [Callosobruchus maculatus]